MVHHFTSSVKFIHFWTWSSLYLDRKRESQSLAPSFSRFDSSLEFIKDNVYREKVQNVNGLCDRIVRAVDSTANEILANNWREN
jgi:hypothetical protein